MNCKLFRCIIMVYAQTKDHRFYLNPWTKLVAINHYNIYTTSNSWYSINTDMVRMVKKKSIMTKFIFGTYFFPDCRHIRRRSSIPTYGDSLGNWINLYRGQPIPYEGNWIVRLRCWWDINLHSVYSCNNWLLSLLQFNHIKYRKGMSLRMMKSLLYHQ